MRLLAEGARLRRHLGGSLQRLRAAVGARAALLLVGVLGTVLAGCDNSPYPVGEPATNTLYTSFSERSPRHLDPVASYWNQDTPYTYSIYEPPYEYHYLKRPFVLQGRTAVAVEPPRYLDAAGRPLPDDAPAERIAESVYDVRLRPGILYQPHPAFAKDAQGRWRYHSDRTLGEADLAGKTSPLDFEHSGTRELVAEDYVYGLKRHATTRVTTPIAGIFSEYIIGLAEYTEQIKAEDAKLLAGRSRADLDKPHLDFRRWPLAGVSAPEKHLLRIRIKGKYPQWKYWMAMPFVAPVPWEAEAFYAQPGMARRGLSLDRWPVGTGPFMLTEFVQDRRHVLSRNPNYRGVPYPCEGNPGDREAGLLADCGKPTPFVDRIVFQIEKEGSTERAKFRQGWLDTPQIERSDNGLSYLVEMGDSDEVRRDYLARGYRFPRTTDLTNWFIGFNMLDPVVGHGRTPQEAERNRKLRQAISMAFDWEELFLLTPKKAGVAAHGPLPPGMFGSREGTVQGMNPVTHELVEGQMRRKRLEAARALLAEAGYPNGRDARTGRPLVLNYDWYRVLTPEFKVEVDWVSRQFAKLGIQLEIRATDNNQFQDKVRKGRHQIYWSGWLADYPDAENFLFLLYGPNGKSVSDGENTSNYANPDYDALFQRLKTLDDGPEKQQVIDRMVALVQQDAPWIFGYIPWGTSAFQPWLHNAITPIVIRDHLRFYRVDPEERVRLQTQWNRPVWWPLPLLLLALLALVWTARRHWQRREQAVALRRPAAQESGRAAC